METWILVTDASKADLYSSDSRIKDLNFVKEFNHPESRGKGVDLVTDRAGEYHSDNMAGSAYERKITPKRMEAEHFAEELVKILKQGHNDHSYEKLIIITLPNFYNLMKKHMHFSFNNIVHIAKDYKHLQKGELLAQIKAHIFT